MKVARFIAVAFFMTLAAVGLAFLVFSFPDARPPTSFESVCTWIWMMVSWPLCVGALMFRQDPPLAVVIPLWIASGVFWAFLVEVLIRARRRYVA